MSKTPTPETDSVTRSSDETPWTPWVCAGHAKRLERERDEARRERDEARRQASVWEKLALREASINGARLCGKEEAK
jgi:hypothetical protein